MAEPLISVITPTWQRHDALLNRCIPSVQAQAYPRVEHVIVSDGPDPALRELIAALEPGRFPVVYAELSAHDDQVKWGAWARVHGQRIAQGELFAHLDDDNTFRPHHLERAAALLAESPDAGFFHSLVYVADGRVCGNAVPQYGHIDTNVIVNRRELAAVADWRFLPGQETIEWDLVERWNAAGVTSVFAGEITVDHSGRHTW
jgi:glycosyltransferase involved in cell wall biosynthesis